MPSEGSADGEIHLKKTFLLAVVTWGNSSIYLARVCVRGIQTTQNYMSASHKRKTKYPNLALGFLSLLCCALLVPLPFTQPSPSLLAKWANAYFLSSLLPQPKYHPSHSLEAFLSLLLWLNPTHACPQVHGVTSSETPLLIPFLPQPKVVSFHYFYFLTLLIICNSILICVAIV